MGEPRLPTARTARFSQRAWARPRRWRLAVSRPARRRRATVYQRIWDVDQSASGLPAIAMDEAGDPARGFVRVDEDGGRDPEHRLFAEVNIPARKRRTYDLCKALFDNYRLDQTKPEDNRPEEAREILALLEAVADAPPMAAARAHLKRQNGASYSDDAWQELIFELWFRQFDDGRNLDLSGFEHVAVGEQKGSEVNGHHFWYKYYLDDWAAFSGQDDIELRRQPLRRSAPTRGAAHQARPDRARGGDARLPLARLRLRDQAAPPAVRADRRLLGRLQHRGI